MSSAGRRVARALVGLAGAQAGLRLAGRVHGRVGPVRVSAALRLARDGGTRLHLPPLGTATASTHRGPLQLRAAADEIDLARASELLHTPSEDDAAAKLKTATDRARADTTHLAAALAARTVLAALGGAAAASALVWRRPADVAGSTAAAAATLAACGAFAAATVDKDAVRDPQLSGLLTEAPRVLGDLRTAPQRIARYRDQLAELLDTGTRVYRRVATLPDAPPPDAIRLVHVSDIHLSPLALPLAHALVDEYHADAVIDTGDLVDWGTPAEAALAGEIAKLGVPYVYVKGNHDSTGIAAAVARQPNAVVLEATTPPVEVVGLRFAGMADPRFTPDKTTGDDHAMHRVGEAAADFAQHLRGHDTDVALVHSPAAGKALAGLAPLVLAGDIHRRDVRRFGDTTMLVQGSSGGAGLRGVQVEPPTPVTLSVLHIDRTTRRLWGVDEVTLGGLGRTELTVVRRTAADLLGEA